MATTTTDFQSSFAAVLSAPFRVVGDFLLSIAQSQRIYQEATILFALSDEELAARGMKRTDIAPMLARDFERY